MKHVSFAYHRKPEGWKVIAILENKKLHIITKNDLDEAREYVKKWLELEKRDQNILYI